jgi:DNA-binding protein YbaB
MNDMLGDLMGNMQEKQEEMKKKLSTISVIEDSNGIRIEATADREIKNIAIDPDILADKEQLEDLLVVTFNKIQDKIAAAEAAESQKLISDMLPPGMGGLFGM